MQKRDPLVVGVTGGIGSGKTTILKGFEKLGVPIYIADTRAKELMNEDKELIENIKVSFGVESYKEGKLNPAYLAEIVFGNRNDRFLCKNWLLLCKTGQCIWI